MNNEELINDYKNGNKEALNEIVKQNEGLVKKIAYHYSFGGKFDIEDLIQEGFIGLMKAADMYNPDLENAAAFSTYSVYWINAKICRYIKKNSTKTLSLEASIAGQDDDISLMDIIADEGPGPEELETDKIYQEELRRDLENVMRAKLTLMEQQVIKMRYGFESACMTQTAIAEIMGKSKARIGEIEHNSLRKLRQNTLIKRIGAERRLEYKLKGYSKKCLRTETIAVKLSSQEEYLLKYVDFKYTGKNPLLKWYFKLLKNRVNSAKELKRISAENYIFSNRFTPGSIAAYKKILIKQSELEEQIKRIDYIVKNINYAVGDLLVFNRDVWIIMKAQIEVNTQQNIRWKEIFGEVYYNKCIDKGVEYIRKWMESNNIQYDF